MTLSEKAICDLFSSQLPSGRLNRCFESDSELIRINGAPCLFTTDEFSAEDLFSEDDPYLLGWNIATGAISDIFACGGQPQYYAHALTVSEGWDAQYLSRFAAGVKDVLEATGARFIGGDCGRSRLWRCTASVIGSCAGSPLLRRGAVAGDVIYLSGPVGSGNLEAAVTMVRAQRGAGFQLAPEVRSADIPVRPAPPNVPANKTVCAPGQTPYSHSLPLADTISPLRLPLRQRESTLIRRYVSSCIDTSDGVCAALATLADVNGCGYAVTHLPYLPMGLAFCCRTSLPKSLLFLGECGEYELLFTLHPEREPAFLAEAAASGLEFHHLGRMTEEARTFEEDGQVLNLRAFRIQARDYPNPEQYLDALLRWLKSEAVRRGRHEDGS